MDSCLPSYRRYHIYLYTLPIPWCQLRGRAVFLSFAGRDFLTNATSTFSAPSPVLAVQLSEISVREWGRGLVLF